MCFTKRLDLSIFFLCIYSGHRRCQVIWFGFFFFGDFIARRHNVQKDGISCVFFSVFFCIFSFASFDLLLFSSLYLSICYKISQLFDTHFASLFHYGSPLPGSQPRQLIILFFVSLTIIIAMNENSQSVIPYSVQVTAFVLPGPGQWSGHHTTRQGSITAGCAVLSQIANLDDRCWSS